METKDMISILAVIAVAVAIVNLSITLTKVSDFKKAITGFAASEIGYVNITILSDVNIQLTNSTVDWGRGVVLVNDSYYNATLTTNEDGDATVVGGNWSITNAHGVHIENIGSVNVSLNASTDKTAITMFGSTSSTNQSYQWKFTNQETNACTGSSISLATFQNVNTSTTLICGEFGAGPLVDELYLDIRLAVPFDFDTSKAGTAQTAKLSLNATAT